MRVESELKRENTNFKGFYMDFPYPQKIRKMMMNPTKIMAQVLEKPIGEE